jgi:hypothetical protein
MSEGPTAAGAARRVGSGTTRLVRAWKALPSESRLAAYASGALFVTLFLPWYQVTLIAPEKAKGLQSASASITGWGAFSFVEAAVLLVAVAVLTLLFQRAEGRAFHLPGGDGAVVLAAGLWTCALIVWRIFDKQGATTNGPSATTSGIEWGIFVALAAAAFLAYAGSRIRAAHRPEPPLPGEDAAPVGSSAAATTYPREATASAGGATRSSGRATTAAARPPARTAVRETARTAVRETARTAAPEAAPTAVRETARTAAGKGATTAPEAAPRIQAPAQPGSRRPVPPRRRPRTPAPVPADQPARQERSARPTPAPEATTEPMPDHPRRRPSAAELFERVVPEDPPTMPFGRAKPADVDATLRMASNRPPDGPAQPARGTPADLLPADEQLTMPLGNDDDTLPLDRD